MSDVNTNSWEHLRAHKWSETPPPPEWDKSIKPMSMAGLSLFGIHQKSGKIYWDGSEVVVRSGVKLTNYQTVLATTTALSAAIVALVELYRVMMAG